MAVQQYLFGACAEYPVSVLSKNNGNGDVLCVFVKRSRRGDVCATSNANTDTGTNGNSDCYTDTGTNGNSDCYADAGIRTDDGSDQSSDCYPSR